MSKLESGLVCGWIKPVGHVKQLASSSQCCKYQETALTIETQQEFVDPVIFR